MADRRNKIQVVLNNDTRVYSDTEQPGSAYGGIGEATYFSSNKQSHSGFYGSVPAGSKHAKRIQQLCVKMQTQRPEQPVLMHPHAQLIKRAPQQPLASVPRPQNVYRYEDDSKVSYHCKSDRGELYVSAPQGSGEARTIDKLARQMLAPKVRRAEHAQSNTQEVTSRQVTGWFWRR
ncbi:hypothetical protein K440DRAFT_658537 [Wilcoxina mikolae CBS 423.85]|nr:hypothetical protein K440DRAFT_658537 [Wilcoxina mikolae CBS 423.85]